MNSNHDYNVLQFNINSIRKEPERIMAVSKRKPYNKEKVN